jgi:hypothetical protein
MYESLDGRQQRGMAEDNQTDKNVNSEPVDEPDRPVETQRRARGRPPGSKNKPKQVTTIVRRSNRLSAPDHQDLEDQFINAIQGRQDISMTLMTNKERADMELSIKLRNEGVIKTPGSPFEQSQDKKIEGLIAKGVFDFVQYDPSTMQEYASSIHA